jgi:hypothetical protein
MGFALFSSCLYAGTARAVPSLSVQAGPVQAAPDQTSGQKPDQKKPEECKDVIARFLDRNICAAEVETAPGSLAAMKKQYAAEGVDAEAAIRKQNLLRLKDLVWTRALEYRFGKDVLAATPEDIAAYNDAFRQSLTQTYEDNKKLLALVKELLDKNVYSLENAQKLQDIQADLERNIAFYEKRQEHEKSMPPEFQAMLDETQGKVAASVIGSWKTDKALYKAFGGRVAKTQDRLEPLDAYRAFIDYIHKEGHLVVQNVDYRDIFKDMEAYLAQDHAYLPAPKKGAPGPFDQPRWYFPGSRETGGDFETLKGKLLAVPVQGKVETAPPLPDAPKKP